MTPQVDFRVRDSSPRLLQKSAERGRSGHCKTDERRRALAIPTRLALPCCCARFYARPDFLKP